MECNTLVTPLYKWASKERQQFVVVQFWIIQRLFHDNCPHSTYRPPFNAEMLQTTLRLSPKHDRQRRVNCFCLVCCIIQQRCNDRCRYSTYRRPVTRQMLARWSPESPRSEHQRSSNNFWSCILHNSRAVRPSLSTINVLANFIRKKTKLGMSNTAEKVVSTESHRFLGWHISLSHACVSAVICNRCIVCLHRPKSFWWYCYCLLKMSINTASTVLVLVQ